MRAFVSRVFQGLLSGELDASHLSARRLSAWLGVSSGWLYHNHGSLNGFLLEVAALGARHLADLVNGDLHDSATTILAFERRHPALYDLLFLRVWGHMDLQMLEFSADDALKDLWGHLADQARELGSTTAVEDADAVMVAIHGAILLRRVNRNHDGGPGGWTPNRVEDAVFHLLRRIGDREEHLEAEFAAEVYGAS